MRWSEDERQLVKATAEAAGLTMNDYLIELARRDQVDEDGRPLWVASGPATQAEVIPGLSKSA